MCEKSSSSNDDDDEHKKQRVHVYYNIVPVLVRVQQHDKRQQQT